VIFIGIRGLGFKGDIAIDDVTISPGDCTEEIGNIVEGTMT